MKITVSQLLHEEYIWNKELVQINFENKDGSIQCSEIKRLEFQYQAIDNDYVVWFIEPYINDDGNPYLILHCYLEEE